MAQLALNNRPNSIIGSISLFFLRHGYNIDPIMDPTSKFNESTRHPGHLSAINLIQRLKDAQDFALASIAAAQQRNESNFNRLRCQPERFQVGDKVWLDLRKILKLHNSQRNLHGFMLNTQ